MGRTAAGLAGVIAAACGAAAAELLAAWLNPAAGPVVAVGAALVDLSPTPVKEWAVASFGTADKTVLMVGVILGLALIAAVAGILAARRPGAGTAVFAVLGALGALAAVTRPAAGVFDLLPALLGTAVAILLLRRQFGWLAEPRPDRPEGTLDRRVLLTGVAGLAASALAVGIHSRHEEVATEIRLPPPREPQPPLPAGVEESVPQVSPLRTPVADFYRVDTALVVPHPSVEDWSLTVDGLVASPFRLTWEELLALPMIERDITLTCVSNEVGGPYCGSTRWLGVAVAPLLRRAGADLSADMVLSHSVDGFTASTPLAVLLDGRDAMIAIAMDGEPLAPAHGFPARLLTPGLYGYVGATKWLNRLQVTTFAADEAYWTVRGWAEQAPVKTACRIDTPRGRIPSGDAVAGGVAWATHRGIGRVEVQVDDGPWQRARLGPDVGLDYWRQWYLPWQASPGPHRLTARAYDADGVPQIAEPAGVLPDGATGYHVVEVTAT